MNRRLPSSLSADKMLEVTRHFSTRQLQGYQARLTTTANELGRLARSESLLTPLLGHDERNQLEQTGRLIRTISQRIKLARQKQQHSERQPGRVLRERRNLGWSLVNRDFPLLLETAPLQLDVVKLALILHRARMLHDFYSRSEFSSDLLKRTQDPERLGDQIQHLRAECLGAIHHVITAPGADLRRQLAALHSLIATLTPTVLDSEAPLLEAWEAALSRANAQEAP